MASDYTELLLEGYDAFNWGDWQWVLDNMDPEFEWVPPPEDPDAAVHRGHDGVRQFWGEWREALGQLRFQVEELIDAGDKVVAVVLRSGIGETSGVEIQDRLVQVFTFRDGKGLRCEEFYDRHRALAAAGLAASATGRTPR